MTATAIVAAAAAALVTVIFGVLFRRIKRRKRDIEELETNVTLLRQRAKYLERLNENSQ